MTTIEWTHCPGYKGETWNPIVGCEIVSPGCANCYAMKMAWRLSRNPATPQYRGTVKKVKGKPVWTGEVHLVEHNLNEPLSWRKPRMVFVNSMSDQFYEAIPDEWIDRCFDVMERCPQHIFQILTKRPHITRSYIRKRYSGNAPPAHIWLGISAERQKEANERIPLLLQTPAVVRFISAEPLLGPIDLNDWINRIDWIIVGGESGVKHPRPMDPEWARDIRDQCEESGVAFFFKQWGGLRPKSGGKVLDGREWCEFPQC